MKKILAAICLLVISISVFAQAKSNDYVEVVYFHGKQRCITCRAIEKYAKEVVNTHFAQQVKQGKVKFREIDFSTTQGEAVADKYRVASSSLFINRWKNGKEQRNDMTRFGFKNARSNPDAFKSGVKAKITELLR